MDLSDGPQRQGPWFAFKHNLIKLYNYFNNVRLIQTLEGISYHVDPTEYGIHWNFFFSLAVVKILGPILIRSFRVVSPAVLSMVILVIYEFCIWRYDIAHLVFGPDRSNFLLANKEGIFSSIGLTSLYLIYVQLGRHLLPLIDEGKGLKNTLTLMFLFWTFLAILHLFNFNPSRRLANFGYVVWICAMAMSFISFCIAGDQFRRNMKVQVPEIITAMNLTQLPGLYLFNKNVQENYSRTCIKFICLLN